MARSITLLAQAWFAAALIFSGAAGCSKRSAPASVGSSAESAAQEGIRISLLSEVPTRSRFFVVYGLDAANLAELAKVKWDPDQWQALFQVQVGPEPRTGLPPVLGTYSVADNMLRFEPRFPLEPGVTYRVRLDPAHLPVPREAQAIEAVFEQPRPSVEATTVVERIYPSRDLLPENQLKFYLYFSAPMARGNVYRHLHLIGASGKEVEHPFLELDQELWDATGKRFTLFFDPGRIKRGLKPREELGPSIEEGKTYTLVIDKECQDARGNSLREPHRKSFRVGPPDDQPIKTQDWKLQAPGAASTEPLVVTFPEPLDYALLHRMLSVVDAEGRTVAGKIQVTNEESRWAFTPDEPWKPGTYALVAETTLEDLAGNKIGEPFEVDVFRPVQKRVETKTVRIPFQVK